MSNILSDKNGNISLIDFGLSRYYEPNESNMKQDMEHHIILLQKFLQKGHIHSNAIFGVMEF
jgi:serine/threonine protein kinase